MSRNKWVSLLCALLVHWGLKINMPRGGQALQSPRSRESLWWGSMTASPWEAWLGRTASSINIPGLFWNRGQLTPQGQLMWTVIKSRIWNLVAFSLSLAMFLLFWIPFSPRGSDVHVGTSIGSRSWRPGFEFWRSTIYCLITKRLPTLNIVFHSCNGNWRFKSIESQL